MLRRRHTGIVGIENIADIARRTVLYAATTLPLIAAGATAVFIFVTAFAGAGRFICASTGVFVIFAAFTEHCVAIRAFDITVRALCRCLRITQRPAVGHRLGAPFNIIYRATGYAIFVGTALQLADIAFRTTVFCAFVFAAAFANRVFCHRAAFATCCADFAAAVAFIIACAGIVGTLVFGCAATVTTTLNHITVGRGFFIAVSITVAGIADAFGVRTVIRANLRAVIHITIAARNVITFVFAPLRFVLGTAGIIFVVIGAGRTG